MDVTIVVHIATEKADKDIAAVATASKTLSICEHAVRLFGGGLEFTHRSDRGISAKLHWPIWELSLSGPLLHDHQASGTPVPSPVFLDALLTVGRLSI